jgi:hypothetical protein
MREDGDPRIIDLGSRHLNFLSGKLSETLIRRVADCMLGLFGGRRLRVSVGELESIHGRELSQCL